MTTLNQIMVKFGNIQNSSVKKLGIDVFDYDTSGFIGVGGGFNTTYSNVGYSDFEGGIVENDVENLGELLAGLRLGDVDKLPTRNMAHRSPSVISRGITRFLDTNRFNEFGKGNIEFGYKDAGINARGYGLSIESYSDIWLPWVTGGLEDYNKDNGFFSNHELADRHTPRLNQFLQRVREVTLEFGGTFILDREDSARNLLFMMGEDGINLDAELPEGFEELDSLSRNQYEMLRERERPEIN